MAKDKGKRLPPGISVRKDGRYQARYTFNGKRHTVYGKDMKERALYDIFLVITPWETREAFGSFLK